MTSNPNQETFKDNDERSAEMVYNALREEILKHFDFQQQSLSITWTVITATLAASVLFPTIPSVALLYPPIGASLTLTWIQRCYSIRSVANYIRDNLEPSFSFKGWETHLCERKGIINDWMIYISNGVFFLLSQVIAVGTGLYNFTTNSFKPIRSLTPLEEILFIIDLLSILVVFFFVVKMYCDECIIAEKICKK